MFLCAIMTVIEITQLERHMKRGRPTEYSIDIVDESLEYLNAFLDEDKRRELKPIQLIPTVEGLCAFIKRSRSTVYKWKEEEGKEDFSDIVEMILEMQHMLLQNGGLAGHYNPTIAKLLLAKHGHSERIESDHTSKDGSMTPNTTVNVTMDDIKSVLGKM